MSSRARGHILFLDIAFRVETAAGRSAAVMQCF